MPRLLGRDDGHVVVNTEVSFFMAKEGLPSYTMQGRLVARDMRHNSSDSNLDVLGWKVDTDLSS